jgi:hypothetical protein
MSVTRRKFLERATVTALAGAVLPVAFAQSGSGGKMSSSATDQDSFFDGISAETFKPFIGDKFSVALYGRSRGSITLVAVSQSKPAASVGINGSKSTTPELDTFTLTFEGSGAKLPQETYTLSQLSLGSFPLFLVPLPKSSAAPMYSAVFNLIKS